MKKPILPKNITSESVRKYKSNMRKWDLWRIENKTATPQEVQCENSPISKNTKIKILKFSNL